MDADLVRRYRSSEGAAAYRRKYGRSWLRRLSNRRELALVGRALERAGASGRVLDCPCGAGRLVPVLLRGADEVVGADLSMAMVSEARDALAPEVAAGRVSLLASGAGALPFGDGAFDVAVCHRLLHHVPEAEARLRILRELARVARNAVVLSFADAATRKAARRRRKGSSCVLLSEADLAREAAACGLVLDPPVTRIAGWFSVQAVAVLRVAAGEPSDGR